MLCLMIYTQSEVSIQWRSEGGQGGHLPPGAARRGAPKSCQRFFLKFIYGEILLILKEKNENVVIFFFDYILDFSAPPLHHLTKLTTIFLYI